MQTGAGQTVEQWGIFELRVPGPVDGNPFDDVGLEAEFRQGHHTIGVEGFYDGGGTHVVRFMPDRPGSWTYELSGHGIDLPSSSGSFDCRPAEGDNHGLVQVRDERRFAYADGSPYQPFGTTCYAWTHQPTDNQEKTLAALADGPFNKIRMCVFPKHYAFNEREPERFPFATHADGTLDWSRFEVAYFQDLERRILELENLGIECDMILFHPYDKGHWGFDRMDAATDERYLRYVIARLAAHRNVWWSLANEFDFMSEKTMIDWDRLFRVVKQYDPYGHLASIHNGTRMYDPASLALYDQHNSWVSHVSLQHWDLNLMPAWLAEWRKPVVVDECGYEGNLPKRWGDLTAQAMTDRIWTGVAHGGYVGHGETFLHDEGVIWWSHGGDLHGESPDRIRFLRSIIERLPTEATPLERFRDAATLGVEGIAYLQHFGTHRPSYRDLDLPEDTHFTIDVIDTWAMTVDRVADRASGMTRVDLADKTTMAILAVATR